MKPGFLIAALASAFASLYAVILALLIIGTQAENDFDHPGLIVPWWTMFGNLDGVLVLCFSLAASGFGWLAWHLCRRAFTTRCHQLNEPS